MEQDQQGWGRRQVSSTLRDGKIQQDDDEQSPRVVAVKCNGKNPCHVYIGAS